MGQLTPEDFSRMQREAKMRVAEMQKRSRFYAESIQRANRAHDEEKSDGGRIMHSDFQHAETTDEPNAMLPSATKSASAQNEDVAELLFLLFLSFLVGEADHDLLLLLMMIMMD